jgi:hypothetical protein
MDVISVDDRKNEMPPRLRVGASTWWSCFAAISRAAVHCVLSRFPPTVPGNFWPATIFPADKRSPRLPMTQKCAWPKIALNRTPKSAPAKTVLDIRGDEHLLAPPSRPKLPVWRRTSHLRSLKNLLRPVACDGGSGGDSPYYRRFTSPPMPASTFGVSWRPTRGATTRFTSTPIARSTPGKASHGNMSCSCKYFGRSIGSTRSIWADVTPTTATCG